MFWLKMGAVKLRVYVSYLRAIGLPMSLLILVALLGVLSFHGSGILSNFWLSFSNATDQKWIGCVA